MEVDDSKLRSLSRIVNQESLSGFKDTTVIGGLDLFIQRWKQVLEPATGDLGSYSSLTSAERELWVGRVTESLKMAKTAKETKVGAQKIRPVKTLPSVHPSKIVKLEEGIVKLKGVSTKHLSKLNKLGVRNLEDILYLVPNRHNDFGNICKVSELEYGKEQTVIVNVWEAVQIRQGFNRKSTKADLGDDTGNVQAIWFNQPYLAKTLQVGVKVVISGKVSVYKGYLGFESPAYELLRGQEDLVHTGRLVPVYPTVQGFAQRTLRGLVKNGLDVGIDQVIDFLSRETRNRNGLIGLKEAIAQIHYPDNADVWNSARYRLAFDELLLLQLGVLRRKLSWQEDHEGTPLKAVENLLQTFLKSLPFELTAAQIKVLEEILYDIALDRPMSRLIQGDVGSGKTVVATAALLVAVDSGCQGALLAPTELLAEQHFITITNILSKTFEFDPKDDEEHIVSIPVSSIGRVIRIALLTGSIKKKTKVDLQKRIANGCVDIVIGTHAVIQEDVEFSNLALAVVDEQHRFGVMQRDLIRNKGTRPHMLAMSATPIPRSLSLTLYGDLDISIIDTLPPGRQAIRTRFVEPKNRAAAYGFIEKEINNGRQAFIVCPLIGDSATIQTRAAIEEHRRLSSEVFTGLKVGLLHGKMPLGEKESVMQQFRQGELNILVSTAVVEVGIDIPNATVMLIDGAERFGLAQLHQFRGRVGRGEHASYCLLLSDFSGDKSNERLRLVERVTDGFELAEEDLRIRGPGDYMGTRQSGMPNLRIARITDQDILVKARKEAFKLLESDPTMSKKYNTLLSIQMRKFFSSLDPEMGRTLN